MEKNTTCVQLSNDLHIQIETFIFYIHKHFLKDKQIIIFYLKILLKTLKKNKIIYKSRKQSKQSIALVLNETLLNYYTKFKILNIF